MIVHIIYNDSKFVDNYISFFNTNFNDLEFYYVIYGRGKKGDIEKYKNNKNVIVINKLYSFSKMMKAKGLMRKADKIIFSGIFGIEYFLYLIFSKSIWDKIYLHFWGGDFYKFRDPSVNKIFITKAIRKCKAVASLINDKEMFFKIFNMQKDFIGVFAPCYKYDANQYNNYINYDKNNKNIKIIFGNSATKENQHIEALECLSKYKTENFVIYCPLSYGDHKYANKVIEYGKNIFGDSFQPLIEYIKYDDYIRLVASCDIAIYNHNRQQAFGNIMLSLALGLKVFFNTENTLYYDFNDLGFDVYDIKKYSNSSFLDFVNFSNKEKNNNISLISTLEKKVINSWSFIRE